MLIKVTKPPSGQSELDAPNSSQASSLSMENVAKY